MVLTFYPQLKPNSLASLLTSDWSGHLTSRTKYWKQKTLFTLKKCLRATWGANSHRLRFLIAATVDPIVLYGCSVWASFLNTKCGVKKLRAYQRSITISIAKSFKTAPTDALLVIANIIPIDLRILQLSTLRFRSDSMKPFVNSSFRWLLKNFPNDSLQLQRAEIVSQYSAFSFAFPGPNLTGLQASNGDLLISIKESSTVFACHDSRSSDRYTTSVVLWLYRRLSGTVLKVQPSRAGTQRSDWRQGLCPTCVG